MPSNIVTATAVTPPAQATAGKSPGGGREKMKNQLRFLTFAAILGCAVYVLAQIGAPARGNQGHLASKSGQRMVLQSEPGSALQSALQSYMIAKQGYLQTLAESEGRSDRITPIIETNCYWMLTTMRPDQQQAEIHNVWKIETWAPNSRWQEIAKAPSMVKALLEVSPALVKKMEAIREANPNMNVMAARDLDKRLYADAKFRALPREEQNVIHRRESEKLRVGKTKLDLQTVYYENEVLIANAIEKLLPPAQKQEWNKIKSKFDRAIMDAYRGESGSKNG